MVVWIALLVVGLVVYRGVIGREGFPPVNTPIVLVEGLRFDDDPALVDSEVVAPLLANYSTVDGVEYIETFARANSYLMVVHLDSGISSADGAARLRSVTRGLGSPVSPRIRAIDATKFADRYDLLISLSGPDGVTAEELQTEAAALSSRLAEDPAIGAADVRILLARGFDSVAGVMETRQTDYTRVVFEGDDDFREAISVGLARASDSGMDVLAFSDLVGDVLADIALGDGFEARITSDFAPEIRDQIDSLTGNLLSGLLVVALVSLLLIGWRVALLTIVSMVSAILLTLICLWLVGYSLNTITLFGLILTLGLLVDDAIVVSEAIDAEAVIGRSDEADSHGPEASLGAIHSAVAKVGAASLSGTVTTVLVFAPMLFVSGILGGFIRAIPATVIITLLVSFVLAVTVIPTAGRWLLLRPARRPGLSARVQRSIGRGIGSVVSYPSGHGVRGWLVGCALVLLGVIAVGSSFSVARGVGFDIFPEVKDSNRILVELDFESDVTVEEAQALSATVDRGIVEILGADLVGAQYIVGDERGASINVVLTPFDERDVTAPDYVDRLDAGLVSNDRMRVSVGVVGVGPPEEDFPFAVQIKVGDGQLDAAERLAADIAAVLPGRQIGDSADATTVTETDISTEGQLYRVDGVRHLEVRAAYDGDGGTTSDLDATEELVADLFPPEDLERRGLDADALRFDFGFESDNQDSIASLRVALVFALLLVFAVLVFQFRSLVQPLLVLLAVPFSFLGVFGLLAVTDNTLSFFVMVGFIALVGVVVNNTILLLDAANQGRRAGLTAGEAVNAAVEHRLRPLVATTITTIVGLLPLALSDPFWEALSFTLIGGLMSSTVLVLLVFPVLYLAVEGLRTPARNLVRRRTGRPEIV